MLNRTKILMNKAGEGDAGGAPKDPPATPPATPPVVEGDGKEYDDHGYEIAKKEGDPAAKAPVEKKAPVTEPPKVDPVTGYDKDVKVDDPPADPPKVDPPPAATELDKKLEGLHPAFAAKVKEQIADLGAEVTPTVLDKIIAQKKQEQADSIEWNKQVKLEADRQKNLRNANWQKELKEDPVIGGGKYLTNTTRAERALEDFGPELKKELTDAKEMLRPSVMRMLMRFADHAWPDDKMVQGDPPPTEDKGGKDEKFDPLAFYE